MTDPTGAFDKAGSGGNNPLARQRIGEGLVGLTGEKWARHRRVIAPAFNMERIKGSGEKATARETRGRGAGRSCLLDARGTEEKAAAQTRGSSGASDSHQTRELIHG
ncbi:hypothetical protein PR202_ga04625 [Eleusine coracana subsp. coracana]|uniref:Uncharacterized protein n=1 Tax=Eleusine coracana subsp. coracana TaxID=191504 RepID=A0AAV5BS98_ELECO|nr:hypothetical protein PR202_ga04625 [Eleusine coracana subsp. coracana]